MTYTYNEISHILGVDQWKPNWFIPEYLPCENGDWKIIPGGQLVHDRGYYSGLHLVEMFPALARKVENKDKNGFYFETWMSITPHEVESQELGCIYANGHTVVMGLGLGWIAANMALNEKVSKVTVIEKDPSVIELFEKSGALNSMPAGAVEKINIVCADAMTWIPEDNEKVDFLYADIWLKLAQDSCINDVKQMQKNVNAETVYFWGQEIAVFNAKKKYSKEFENVLLKDAVAQFIGLPLLIPHDFDYDEMIENVIKNRINRKLNTDVDL